MISKKVRKMEAIDISKLKIDGFKNICAINFPHKYQLGFPEKCEIPVEVIIYYIDTLLEVPHFIETVQNADLAEDNRVIFVYKKNRKDGVSRDTIYFPFKNKEVTGFKMKHPMLCSLSKELSAFVQIYIPRG
jgi:hypothetical protein